MTSPRPIRLPRRIALTLGACAIAIAVAEGAVRLLDVAPRPLDALPVMIYRLSANPILGYEYLPTAERGPDFKTRNTWFINSDGLRDREFDPAKPEGGTRILALGDSTTAGHGISDAELLFTRRLEVLLNEAGGSSGPIEVLNMGVSGYHTMQEAELLRTRGLKLDPDLVLVTVCINDFSVHTVAGMMDRLRERNEFTAENAATSEVVRTLLRNSRLAFVLYHRLGLNVSTTERDRLYAEEALGGRSPVQAGFELLSELARAHGFEVVAVILPEFRNPFDEYQSSMIHAAVVEAAADLEGLRVIDLLESFAAAGPAGDFTHDGLHMNEQGHAVMARILHDLLRNLPTTSG